MTMASVLESEIELVDGMAFRARSGSGYEVLLDASKEAGGAGSGMRPIELLLLGLGGCTGMDVIGILRKMRQDVTDYRIRVRGVRRSEHPMVFTAIAVEHVVSGRNLNPDAVRRGVELSVRRYCSVSAMLEASVPIVVTYRVVDLVSGKEVTGHVGPSRPPDAAPAALSPVPAAVPA